MRLPSISTDSGFALVVVIWAAGLLAAIAATFTLSARTHVKEAAAVAGVAKAEALADGGVAIVLADLVRQRLERRPPRFAPNGATVACSFGDGRVLSLSLQDESGRVDLNTADERLIAAALGAAGVSGARAAALADAIIDFRDLDDEPRTAGAERAQYVAAGRLAGPKNAPFAAIEELAQVLGLDAEVAQRLAPLVSLNSGLAGIDTRLMPPGLRGLRFEPDQIAASPQSVFAVRAQAQMADGTLFVREALVQWTGARTGLPYVVKRWTRGAAASEAQSSTATALPPC